MLVIKMSF